jgi:hypothetical protein
MHGDNQLKGQSRVEIYTFNLSETFETVISRNVTASLTLSQQFFFKFKMDTHARFNPIEVRQQSNAALHWCSNLNLLTLYWQGYRDTHAL